MPDVTKRKRTDPMRPDKAALRALVARVDGSGNGAGAVADGAP